MTTASMPHQIEAFTTADAVEVNSNYEYTAQFLNTNVVHRDGTKSMTGPLILVNSSPADDLHAASRGYVDAFLPIGVIMPYGGAAAPAGGKWALCDGASKSTTAFPELFAVLQYRYGGSAGTFNLPNLKGRLPVGADAGVTRFSTTGKKGGSWLVPVPSHTHGIDHNHGSFNSGGQSVTHTHPIDHNHAAFTTAASGAHDHTGRFLNVYNPGAPGAAYGALVNSVSAFSGSANVQAGTGPDGAHAHSVDIPNFDGTSGNASVTHTHTVDIPNFDGTSAAYEKEIQIDDDPVTKTTTEHVPPYVVLNYIIRVQ